MANYRKEAAIIAAAEAAGMAAGNACEPATMIVNGASKQYIVHEGCCGFAWVNIKPGNSRIANYLKKSGKARSSYHGGIDVWVSEFGQSMARKEDYAGAYARVLRDNGIDRAYSMSRMD